MRFMLLMMFNAFKFIEQCLFNVLTHNEQDEHSFNLMHRVMLLLHILSSVNLFC